MPNRRVRVSKHVAATLRVRSANRCCVCRAEREAQIHHIDGDPSHGAIENLAFLCLLCHSDASRSGGFGRKLDPHTVRAFRDEWHEMVARSKDLDGLLSRLVIKPDALMEAVAARDVWRIGVRIRKLDVADPRLADHVNRLFDYTNSFSGQASVEVVRILYDLVARTRTGMPAELAQSVAHLALDAAPLVRWVKPEKGLTEEQTLRFAGAVEVGLGLAYDGALYLKDLRVVHAGARLLRFLLAGSRRHPKERAAATDAFERALDAADRSKTPLAKEILLFERAEASEEGATLTNFSRELLEFVGLADIALQRRAEAGAADARASGEELYYVSVDVPYGKSGKTAEHVKEVSADQIRLPGGSFSAAAEQPIRPAPLVAAVPTSETKGVPYNSLPSAVKRKLLEAAGVLPSNLDWHQDSFFEDLSTNTRNGIQDARRKLGI